MGRSKDGIKIFLRLRPHRQREGSVGRYEVENTFDDSKITFHLDRRNLDKDYVNSSREEFTFHFDRVFDQSTTQSEVFEKVAEDSVRSNAALRTRCSASHPMPRSGNDAAHRIAPNAAHCTQCRASHPMPRIATMPRLAPNAAQRKRPSRTRTTSVSTGRLSLGPPTVHSISPSSLRRPGQTAPRSTRCWQVHAYLRRFVVGGPTLRLRWQNP